MVTLAEADAAAWEATAAVAVFQGPTQRGRNGARAGAHFYHSTVLFVAHDDAGRVARQATRRLRGNVRATFEHRLAGRRRISQHRRIDMDDDLIPFAHRPRIDAVMQRGLSRSVSASARSCSVDGVGDVPAGTS
jgi:hypothetical protein